MYDMKWGDVLCLCNERIVSVPFDELSCCERVQTHGYTDISLSISRCLLYLSLCRNTIQSNAVMTPPSIVRYYIDNCKNLGTISIRCRIHKRHSKTHPSGRAMSVFCVYLWENWPRYNHTVYNIYLCTCWYSYQAVNHIIFWYATIITTMIRWTFSLTIVVNMRWCNWCLGPYEDLHWN